MISIKKIKDASVKSWKTTIVGLMTMITLSWAQIALLLDNDVATNPDWNIVVGAVFAFVLGLLARDNDVDSESAGAKVRRHR